MKRPRSLLIWGTLALIAASANAFAVKTAASPVSPIPGFDVGSIIGDAMSPVNPYNSGADPITMPGDARMAVFPYSRDQIYRVMTAPLKLTTIELERGESLISEPAMGDSVQWVIDTDGANHVYVKPTKPGLVNTLHLSTNKREYELTLVSSPLGGLFYQNVRFNYTVSNALSGGKDSTCTAILMLEAVRRAGAEVSREHFVTSADTTIENPSMHWHLQAMLDEIRDAYADAGTSVSVHVAKPSLASQFVVATIGRGTLPRTPENGVKNGKRIRACAADWKVDPQNRLRVALERSAAASGSGEVVTILGNRFDESGSRAAAMTARSENALRPVRNADGLLTFSPIAEWSTDCVWAMLSLFAADADRPFPSPISAASIRRLSDLYRAGNEGTCGVILGEGGARAACGSRFGCAFCCVSGERDRSMESMVKEPEHQHLEGLNRFRNYLVAVQWDLGRRELVGRKLSDAGYLAVKPDVLSYRERLRLLQYLLTLDVLEVERAERHEGALATGEIPDTPENRALCDVQFEMITPAQLVAIDFYLSMHHYAPHAFPALSVWFDVHRLGRRYHVPVLAPLPKTDIPHHGWFYVGAYDAEAPADGLRDYTAEQWNRYLHPDRPSRYARTKGGEQIVYFEEGDQFEVDNEAACAFVTCSFDAGWSVKAQQHAGMESARFWLNEGILRLPAGMAGRYQEMAKRGQYFARLAERFNLTPAELDRFLVDRAISNAEHLTMLNLAPVDLFSQAA